MNSILFALVALQGLAPGDTGQARVATPADSVRIARAARSAQQSFEAFRRNRLPVGYGFSGPCDVHIGRYCYWRGEEADNPEPPENAQIKERRGALIATLDSASRTLRGDAWIAGQHVRYLVEAARIDDAIKFAREDCHATPSWCAALTGYAAHLGERFALADSAFSQALAVMETEERCRWIDISRLIDDDLERRFKKLDCAGREQMARRLFWFGAPLYSVSSTDLLTEHMARLTRIRISERAATINGLSWGDDERELVLRYGWPRWYSRSAPSAASQSQVITGHDAGMPYHFFPSARAIDSVGTIDLDDWTLSEQRARTGYAPSYAKTVHAVPAQIALFRRGDSTLAVGAWDARRDTTLIGRSIDAALVLAAPGSSATIVRVGESKTTGRITVTGLIDSGLVSLELLSRENHRAARVRLGVPPRSSDRIALSDILLYAPSTSPAYELSAVRDSALASPIISPTRSVGVYWETYGLRPGAEPVDFTLTVEQVDVGWIQRAAEALRFADPASSLRIQWSEMPEHRNGVAGRGVRVDLSRLRDGRYRVELGVITRSGERAVSSREIEIR